MTVLIFRLKQIYLCIWDKNLCCVFSQVLPNLHYLHTLQLIVTLNAMAELVVCSAYQVLEVGSNLAFA